MFGYAPTVNDMSGQIMGQGMASAAQIAADGRIGAAKTGVDSAQVNAQMMSDLGQNIGGALQTIGSVYGELEGRKAKGRAFKKTLEVLGPSIGMTTDKLKAAFGDLRNDMDYYNASEMLMPILPSMINLQLGGMNAGVRREQMGVQTALPGIRASIDNTQNVVNQGGPQIQGARFQRNPNGN